MVKENKESIRIKDIAEVILPITKEECNKKNYPFINSEIIIDKLLGFEDVKNQIADSIGTEYNNVIHDGDIMMFQYHNRIHFIKYNNRDWGQKKYIPSEDVIILRIKDHENYPQIRDFFVLEGAQDIFESQLRKTKGEDIKENQKEIIENIKIPNINTLNNAYRARMGRNLEEKCAIMFRNKGWEVIRANSNWRYDVMLATNGEVVGAVETKRCYGSQMKIKRYIDRNIVEAEKAIQSSELKFFLIWMNDVMYAYNNNKFYEIQDIPTPDNYQAFIANKKEYRNEGNGLYSLDKKVSYAVKLLEKSVADVNTINSKVDIMSKKLDDISYKIQGISNQISVCQDLEAQALDSVKEFPEIQENLMGTFTNTITNRIIGQINEKKSESPIFVEVKDNLVSSFGTDCWDKMDEKSRRCLETAKVMYKKMSEPDLYNIADYSGVCLLVTKALENELSNRFFTEYLSFYKRKHHREDICNAPRTLINTTRKGTAIWQNKFTLGDFSYIVGAKSAKNINDEQKDKIENSIYDYVVNKLMPTYSKGKSKSDVLQHLWEYADQVDNVRENYRNPSAHTGALSQTNAKECMDLVIDVTQLLKKILTDCDY